MRLLVAVSVLSSILVTIDVSPAHSAPTAPNEPVTEFTPAPLIGGSSDVGFGGGILASLAHRVPNLEPYQYRIELATTTTVRGLSSGNTESPYQDYYLLFSLPHAKTRHTELELRVSYTREANLKYYGLGNQSKLAPDTSLTDSLYEYVRTHPEARIRIRQHLYGRLYSDVGIRFVHNRLEVPVDSLLSIHRGSADRTVSENVRYTREHATATFGYGLVLDLRDHAVVTNHGQYYAARIDLSPGSAPEFPFRFARFNGSFRWFIPLAPSSTVAFRITSDLLFGDVPVYELARYDDTSALGGPKGVRGVPAQRYHGKAKVFFNLQWRQVLFRFRLLGKDNALALALFLDGGRLWADYEASRHLDGTTLGLKWGVGAGPHLIAGKSFVVRADVAWSPDAKPIGAYLAAGEIF